MSGTADNHRKETSGLLGLGFGMARPLVLAGAAAGAIAASEVNSHASVPGPIVNHAYDVTFTGTGTNKWADSWSHQPLPVGAKFKQVVTFNPGRFSVDPNGGWIDYWGTIVFTAGTNSMTNYAVFVYPSAEQNMVVCGDLAATLAIGVSPAAHFNTDSLKAAITTFNNFHPSSDTGAIFGPIVDSGYTLEGITTGASVAVTTPELSISLSGTNVIVSYPSTNALTGIFDLQTTSSLASTNQWTTLTNATESINTVTNGTKIVSFDQFTAPRIMPLSPQILSRATGQVPVGKSFRIGSTNGNSLVKALKPSISHTGSNYLISYDYHSAAEPVSVFSQPFYNLSQGLGTGGSWAFEKGTKITNGNKVVFTSPDTTRTDSHTQPQATYYFRLRLPSL